MPNHFKIIAICAFCIIGLSSNSYSQPRLSHKDGRVVSNEEYARSIIKKALANSDCKSNKGFFSDTLVKSKAGAIKFAEKVAINIYGKDQINGERPFDAFQIDGWWYVAGTLPEDSLGGVFEIVFSAMNYHIIYIAHGK